MLYIFSGLPATGKTTLSKFLAKKIEGTYLRIDTIEQTLRKNDLGVDKGQGYDIAYKIAFDNLKLGLDVIADSVNPLPITRKAWRNIANKVDSPYYEIEIICSDKEEHKRRVKSRHSDIDAFQLLNWENVIKRNYTKWISQRIIIDTSNKSITESQKDLIEAIRIKL